MGYLHIGTGIAGSALEFALQDVGELLDVESASLVALAEDGIDVAAVVVEGVAQSHLWQQLVIGVLQFVLKR